MKFKLVITLFINIILIFSFASVSHASATGLRNVQSYNDGGFDGNSGDGGVSLGGLIWKKHSRVRCEARAVILAEKIGNINVQRFANELFRQLTIVSSAYYHSNNHKENASLTDYVSNEMFLSKFRSRINSELPDLYEYGTIADCNDTALFSNVKLTPVQKQNITEALNDLIRNIKP